MNRVVIIGSPGSGKTTLAKKLAYKTKLPLIHLDWFYHQKMDDYYNDKVAWRAKVRTLANGASWVMDGNYSSTLEYRVKRCDTVIFLDYSTRTALGGVFGRLLTARFKKRDDMPEDWVEKIDWSFIKYVLTFRRSKRPAIIELVRQYEKSKRIIVLKNRMEADAWQEKLSVNL